jgi:hypothetical protein
VRSADRSGPSDDPGKLIAHLMELDKQYADRMLKAPERSATTRQAGQIRRLTTAGEA